MAGREGRGVGTLDHTYIIYNVHIYIYIYIIYIYICISPICKGLHEAAAAISRSLLEAQLKRLKNDQKL